MPLAAKQKQRQKTNPTRQAITLKGSTKLVTEFFKYAAKHNIVTAELSDFGIVIGSAFFQYFLFLSIKRNFGRFLSENIDEKYQGEERLARVEKMSKLMYDSIFYSSASGFAFYCFMNTNVIPKYLFGQGECDSLFDGYPHKPQIPIFNEFYLYQMGNHLYRLIHHWIVSRKDEKFYEMHLHHWIAFWLIAYSYLLNYTNLGGIVIILHDVADIFFSSGRVYDSLRNKIKVIWYGCAISILISWIYSRLIFFPACVIYTCWTHMEAWGDLWPIVKMQYYFMFSLLLVLLILHTYWVVVFIKLAAAPGSKKAEQSKSLKVKAN